MPRRRIEKTRADELLDELLEDYQGPEAIFGKEGLLKQLTRRRYGLALEGKNCCSKVKQFSIGLNSGE